MTKWNAILGVVAIVAVSSGPWQRAAWAQDAPAAPAPAAEAPAPAAEAPAPAPAAPASAEPAAAPAAPKPAAAPASEAAPPAGPTEFQIRRQNLAKITEAVKQLMAEARELDELENIKVPAVFKRPHPALQAWGPEMSVDVLTRMLQPFTGNEYRDTYIRWHLMHVVKKMAPEDRSEAGRRLVRLVKMMPGPVNAEFKPTHRDEPPDIAAEWHRLWASTHVRVGYKPFERDYWGEASIPHVDAARAAKIREALAKMETLKGKWKRIPFPEAIAFNRRVREINHLIRTYRGEVIYAMLQTGDPSMVKLVTSEIEKQVRARQRIAFDLMAFVYMASFDGVLELYDRQTLINMGNDLHRIGASADEYILYKIGDKDPPNYMPNRIRNFADYVYHMVHMLKEIERVSDEVLPSSGDSQVRAD